MPRRLIDRPKLLAKGLAEAIERLGGSPIPLFEELIFGEASFVLPTKDGIGQLKARLVIFPLRLEYRPLAIHRRQDPAQQGRQTKGKGDRAENFSDASHCGILPLGPHFLRGRCLGILAIFFRISTSSLSKYGLRSKSGGSDEKFFSTFSICSCMKAL